MKIELTTCVSFDSDASYDEIKEFINKISPICEYGRHYFVTKSRAQLMGGVYHFVFDEDYGKLQKIRLHVSDFRTDKIHTITLWRRHWWT